MSLSVEISPPSGRRSIWHANARKAANRPTNLRFSTSRGNGFATARVTLARRVLRDYADLDLLNTIRYIDDQGRTAFEGFVLGLPRSLEDGGERITVQAIGYMRAAKDRRFQECYVARDPNGWREPWLELLTAAGTSTSVNTDFMVSVTGGGLSIEMLVDRTVPSKSTGQIGYALPDGVKVAEIQYQGSVVANANMRQDWKAENNRDGSSGETHDITSLLDDTLRSLTLNSPRQYVRLFDTPDGSAVNKSSTHRVTVSKVALYSNHGLDLLDNGSEPDGIAASEMIKDSAMRFTILDSSSVEDTFYPVSHAAPLDPTYPADFWAELNAYHDYNLSVWEGRKLHFAPYDLSKADWEVRTDDPGVTLDLQGDSAMEVGNGVEVVYTDVRSGERKVLYPDDNSELRTDDAQHPATRHGRDIWPPVEVPFPTVEADALQIGEIALADRLRPKAPGTIGARKVYDREGNEHPPYMVREGQTVALADHPNDRPRLITSTDYERGARIEVERPSARFDRLLARVAQVRRARGRS